MIVTVDLNPALDRTLAVPRFIAGEFNRARLVRLDVGGKGLNVARALRALGTPPLVVAVLGGATGQLLRQGLEDLGIAGDFVLVEGESRQNLTILDQASGHYTKINEAGPVWTEDTVDRLLVGARERAATGDAWVLSGRLPPTAPADVYARLIALLQSKGARVYLDSSGEALRLGCQAAPYAVKPNVEEAGEVVGRALVSLEDLVDATRALQGMGVHVVAISRGADGALVAQDQRIIEARPPHMQVRSTVGAGDAFTAGLVSALEAGADLPQAARWAVACGTAAAAEEGTGVGTREAVEALAEEVTIEEICPGS